MNVPLGGAKLAFYYNTYNSHIHADTFNEQITHFYETISALFTN